MALRLLLAAGYRSPPSAGRTQPSAATLAALQSPQPSCVHEPFWTPFTGLFKVSTAPHVLMLVCELLGCAAAAAAAAS